MTAYEYRKIDAFTSGNSLGNPAACIYLKEGQHLSDGQMLDIAKQHKGFVSEMVYCEPRPDLSFGLAYYSSECEVDFCGHGTVACLYSLIKETESLLDRKEIVIRTNKKGTLTVYNEVLSQDCVYITAPLPRFIGTDINENTLAQKLRLPSGHVSEQFPVDLIDAGLRTLIVPVSCLEDEIRALPDEKELREFCLQNEIDIILTYSLEVADARSIAHTRVFAPKFGYLEDPATGSGNSAFGYYLLKNNLWDGKPAAVEQGGAGRVYNSVSLTYKNERMLFGGRATTRIKGVYLI